MEQRGKSVLKEGMEKAPSSVREAPEETIVKALMSDFPTAITDFKKVRDGLVRAKVERRDLVKACSFLKNSLGFEHISMISAVEYENRFEIVYHISSYSGRMVVELITTTPLEDPTVDSVSSIWGGANWQEREAYDLMGIKFNNHPKLERILLPKDYLYHPLRKDFKGGD